MNGETRDYPVTASLKEDHVWAEFAKPLLTGLPENVLSICAYGFTEMVNNVIDHSGSTDLQVEVDEENGTIVLWVIDQGVGVFRKVRDAQGLSSEHDAAMLFAKRRRLTTDPKKHTGEGIFYTGRLFDCFWLMSGEISLRLEAGKDDYWFEDKHETPRGTGVKMELAKDSKRTTKEVFGEAFQPDKSVLFLGLRNEDGGRLVSRSQAKRLANRFEEFRTIVLDFEGVAEVGPGFIDEVFRVFGRERPGTRIVPLNTNEEVTRLIVRTLSREDEASPPTQPT